MTREPAEDRALESLQPEAPSTLFATSSFSLDRPPAPKSSRNYFVDTARWRDLRLPKFKPLPYLEECRLIQRAQAGDLEARDRIWVQHLRLICKVMNSIRIPDEYLEDAFQEGTFGVCRSIAKFDIHRYLAFSTYAFRSIQQAIHRSLSNFAYSSIRVPAQHAVPFYKFNRCMDQCHSRSDWFDLRTRYLDEQPTDYISFVRLHCLAHPERVDQARELASDRRTGVEQSPPDYGIELEDDLAALRTAVLNLEPRDGFVIIHRFGLFGADRMTLVEIGDHLGLTKERIRQIEMAVIRTLRATLFPYIDQAKEDAACRDASGKTSSILPAQDEDDRTADNGNVEEEATLEVGAGDPWLIREPEKPHRQFRLFPPASDSDSEW